MDRQDSGVVGKSGGFQDWMNEACSDWWGVFRAGLRGFSSTLDEQVSSETMLAPRLVYFYLPRC